MAKDRRKNDRRSKPKRVGRDRRGVERREGDRRMDPRVSVEIWLEEEIGPEMSFRRTGDLSAGGVHLDRGFPRPVGTRVKLKFALPEDEQPIEVAAEVVDSEVKGEELSTRLRFVDIAGPDHVRITAFIQGLEPDRD